MSDEDTLNAPWGWCYDGSSTYSIGGIDDPQGELVASVRTRDGDRGAQLCALIAAAPELLAAVELLLQLGGDDDRRIVAEQAVAKARGR